MLYFQLVRYWGEIMSNSFYEVAEKSSVKLTGNIWQSITLKDKMLFLTRRQKELELAWRRLQK